MATDTKVILVNSTVKENDPEREKEFTLKHAQDLLVWQEKHPAVKAAWSLKPESGYTYENGTIAAKNTGKVKNAPTDNGNSGSAQP